MYKNVHKTLLTCKFHKSKFNMYMKENPVLSDNDLVFPVRPLLFCGFIHIKEGFDGGANIVG